MNTADFDRAKNEAKKMLEINYIKQPPVDVIEIAENLGIDLRYINFGEKYNQVAGYISVLQNKKTISVNKDDSRNRQSFTIAHEIGHLVLHEAELKDKPDISILLRMPIGGFEHDRLEKEANCFAANLLVPREMLDQNRNKSVDELSAIFKVSKDVIRFRMRFEYDD